MLIIDVLLLGLWLSESYKCRGVEVAHTLTEVAQDILLALIFEHDLPMLVRIVPSLQFALLETKGVWNQKVES